MGLFDFLKRDGLEREIHRQAVELVEGVEAQVAEEIRVRRDFALGRQEQAAERLRATHPWLAQDAMRTPGIRVPNFYDTVSAHDYVTPYSYLRDPNEPWVYQAAPEEPILTLLVLPPPGYRNTHMTTGNTPVVLD